MVTKLTQRGFYSILAVCFALVATGKDRIEERAKRVVEEGKLLYRSEMASWRGSDLIVQQLKDKEVVGGYFSYTEQDIAKCIFFSKGENPKVIGAVLFDSSYNEESAKMEMSERDFTVFERDLYTIRKNALEAINNDRKFFSAPENTSLNLIPLIWNGEKKVYILTGPERQGVMVIGNDYCLTFDDKNELQQQKRIHVSTIILDCEKNKDKVGAMHTHLPKTGDIITATDIYTLMLYEKSNNWKTHVVFSQNYISIWDCKTDELTVTKR